MKLFTPVTSGTISVGVSPNFISALAERIRCGLFPMAAENRNAYEVISQNERALQFRSTNIWTGINVGLNNVTVNVIQPDRIEYTIRYWTWTKYAIATCLSLFLTGVLAITVGRIVLPAAWFAEFDKSPWIGISMLVFWGLLWPWVLTAMHKKSVRSCFERILDEVNESNTLSDTNAAGNSP